MQVNPEVEIHVADAIPVDRGQPVTVEVAFDHDPDEIYFAYLRPGEERPTVDDGFGQPKSRIRAEGPALFRYTMSTVGWKAGLAWWHFWSMVDGEVSASIFGKLQINDAPLQLL